MLHYYVGILWACFGRVAVFLCKHVVLNVTDCGFTLESRHLGLED